jgi:DNA-directed RNA polymerase subunit M/transcription elongation factor TFIIS
VNIKENTTMGYLFSFQKEQQTIQPKIDKDSYGSFSVLNCSLCGGENVHQQDVEVFIREEDANKGLHVSITSEPQSFKVDENMNDNPSPRRQGLKIKFWCEQCGTSSYLYILQHKGETIMFGAAK